MRHPPPKRAKAGRRGPSRAIACFRDHKPITNRQKPSKTQPRYSPWRAVAHLRGHTLDGRPRWFRAGSALVPRWFRAGFPRHDRNGFHRSHQQVGPGPGNPLGRVVFVAAGTKKLRVQ